MTFSIAKTTGILALIIGSMAVVAGGRVLLGILPDYYVINWLPLYNYTAGILTVSVAAGLLWTNHRYGRAAAVALFAAHALVLATLLVAYRPVVAPDSLRAMSVRLIVWTLILTLLFGGPSVSDRYRWLSR